MASLEDRPVQRLETGSSEFDRVLGGGLVPGSMVLVGIAWASILSMPYAMLSNAIPASKMGFYMGVFNFFIVLPQILASLGLGLLMKAVLGGNPMNAVLLGGCSMALAGLCVGFVSKKVDEVGTPD